MVGVFSFRGHTDTYRMVAVGRGAFELCLPSLGILYQNRMLWCVISYRTLFMMWLGSGGPDRPPWIKVATACGSATLCLGVGGSPTTSS